MVVVRHGQTEWSSALRHTGRTDIPLTDRGREQARAVGPMLADREFATVLASPLARAAETCRVAGYGDRRLLDDRLMEWDYGEYEGLTTDQIRARDPGWTVWPAGAPGGETPEQVAERVDSVIAELRASGGDGLVFAHGHVLRVLAARWVGLEPAAGRLIALATGSIGMLGSEREQPVIRRWNLTPQAP